MHESSGAHDTGPGHPERPARYEAVRRAVAGRPGLRSSSAVDLEVLCAVHPRAYVGAVASARGALDPDTVVGEASFSAALHGAGGAVAVVDAVLGGEAAWGASLHRPPGHHAETARAMGFCLFNNVAVAAQRALDEHGAGRVFVFDWDVHHGNGTEEIFWSRDDVLFASIHQTPLYPGTGAALDVGAGRGEGFTVNLPVPAGSGDEVFLSLTEHVVAPLCAAYQPGLVLVSAGFDAHRDDPLAECMVSDDGFFALAAGVRGFAAACGAPVGLVLEGGYDVDALARSLVGVLDAFEADAAPDVPPVPVHPLADAAARRLAARWPSLAA